VKRGRRPPHGEEKNNLQLCCLRIKVVIKWEVKDAPARGRRTRLEKGAPGKGDNALNLVGGGGGGGGGGSQRKGTASLSTD